MAAIGLNHVTMARASTLQMMDVAAAVGCVGVELRTDLVDGPFSGKSPNTIRNEAEARRLRILALAEVYAFNDVTDRIKEQVGALARQANECGAEAIVLVPRVAENPVVRRDQRTALHTALEALRPIVEAAGVKALIEPLGFANSSLRFKADAVDVLDQMGRPACFALIHDTFHHALAQETDVFADMTRLVHVSAVRDQDGPTIDLTDGQRGLVDQHDRLGTLDQIATLHAQGYDGPLSFEVFDPAFHSHTDPTEALCASANFITSHGAALVA